MASATQVIVRKLRKLEMCSFEWLVVQEERITLPTCPPASASQILAKPCRLHIDNEPERFNCCRRQEQTLVHSSEPFDGT